MDSGSASRIVVETPKSPTFIETITNTFDAITGFATKFGNKGGELVNAITDMSGATWSNPFPGAARVLKILSTGLAQGVEQFASTLGTTSINKFYEWLFRSSGKTLSGFPNLLEADGNAVTAFLLQYAGLTWDHVYEVAQQQLGAGNLAALETVAGWFGGADRNNPASMLAALDNLYAELAGTEFSFEAIKTRALSEMKGMAATAVPKAGALLVSKFTGGGTILALAKGLQWLVDNASQLTDLFGGFVESIDALKIPDDNTAIAFVKDKVATALGNSLPVFLSFGASQLGLSGLPKQIETAVSFVPTEVDKAIRAAIDKVAARVVAAIHGPNATLFKGKLAAEREFQYQGTTFVLWAASVDKVGSAVKIAEKTGATYRYIGELKADSFTTAVTTGPGMDGRSATAHMQDLVTAAKKVYDASKAKPTAGAAKPLDDLKALQAAVTAAEVMVETDILANACTALNAGCFAAGTKLLTKTGWRAVETIRPGDEVASRHESDPTGDVAWKVVEDTFRRTGCILHVHAGGQVIRTTPEHPFWVAGKAWTAAGSLRAGDRIATLSGEWVAIDEVFDTEQWEPVFNLRVADFHTYFVGDSEWGFSAWAHNLDCATVDHIVRKVFEEDGLAPNGISRAQGGAKIGNRAEWASFNYTIAHLEAKINQLYPNQYQPSEVQRVAKVAAVRLFQASRFNLNPVTAAFSPKDTQNFRPHNPLPVPVKLSGVAHEQYVITKGSQTINPIVANLNDGAWDVALSISLGSRGKVSGVYILRSPSTGAIYKVGKSTDLIGRMEQYSQDWVARGIPVQAEIYSIPNISARSLAEPERVLRDRVIRIVGWDLNPQNGAADGTFDELDKQGTLGWYANVRV